MKKMLLTVSAIALFSLAQPFSSGAAVYEISAAGKSEAAAAGNCRANALRAYLNSIVSPADSKQHAMELRSSLFRNLRKFTEIEVLDSQKEAKRVRTRARVTVNEDAVRAALADIPGLAVAPPADPEPQKPEAQPTGTDVAQTTEPDPQNVQPAAPEANQGTEQPSQPDVQIAAGPEANNQGDAPEPQKPEAQPTGTGVAQNTAPEPQNVPPSAPEANQGDAPEPQNVQQQAAMPAEEFAALVQSAEQSPQAIIDALQGGADPNALAGGVPALAAYLGQESGPKFQDKKADVVKAFLKAGADASSVLRSAWRASLVQEGEGMEIFRAVLAAKPDLNRMDGPFGRPFLHGWLADEKHRTPEMLEYILSCGADPNLAQNDRKGATPYRTPILFDAIRGAVGEPLPPAFLQVMLRAGADPNCKNAMGETALCHAVKSGAAEAVKLLLEAGADPNIAANNGETPLADAVFAGNAVIARMLAEKNANAGAPMPFGREKLPIKEYAAKYGSEEMKALFAAPAQ